MEIEYGESIDDIPYRTDICGNYKKGTCTLTGNQCPHDDEQDNCEDYE